MGTYLVTGEPLQDLDLRGTVLRERTDLGTGPVAIVHCNLSGADLRGLDLPGWQARLNGSSLDSAVFTGGSARGAAFLDCDLAGARFDGVDASDARFGNALMSEAEFRGCRLMGTMFEGTRGLGMLLQNSNLYASNLNPYETAIRFGGKG